MNFIVLDLEWNQCPEGKENEEKALPFEILEIGAVKLNEAFEEIGRFCETIRPCVYQSFHSKTREILHLDMKDLTYSRTFPEVAPDFFRWCGEDTSFCTWGPSDLTELQRNLAYYNMESPFPFPLYFYDIQKIFSIVYEDRKSRRTLEHSIDVLQIPKNMEFHDALSDAYYTSCVMKHLPFADIRKNYSIDYYKTPKNRKEEIYVVFDTYSKFVSKEFDSKTEAMRDRKVNSTKCYLCYKAAKKKIRWFSTGAKNYYCLARCEEHGWLRGKIRLKKAESGRFFCVKTLKLISDEEAQDMAQKHLKLQLKHKQKAREKAKIT